MRLYVAFCTLWLTWLALVEANHEKLVCYFGSWALNSNSRGVIKMSDIDPTLCTHLIYAFAGVNLDGTVRVSDPSRDLSNNGVKGGYENFNALRERNPGLKTLLAIGGGDEPSATFSAVVGNSGLRSNFVRNIVDFVLRHGFNGCDLDWEFPNQRGGVQADIQNFGLLVKELRNAFNPHGLLLSAAVSAPKDSARLSYNIAEISEHLHFVNLMAYDFHGAWVPKTGHNGPLYAAARETTDYARTLNVDATVRYWLDQGTPRHKLVVGVGLYGRSFTLTNPSQTVPGSPASGAGKAGPYFRDPGVLGYMEICELQAQGSWTTAWDTEQRVPYTYSGNQWVSYDDVRSVTQKAQYAKDMNLGGAMVWHLGADDFDGFCGEKFPLLKSLNRVLRPQVLG